MQDVRLWSNTWVKPGCLCRSFPWRMRGDAALWKGVHYANARMCAVLTPIATGRSIGASGRKTMTPMRSFRALTPSGAALVLQPAAPIAQKCGVLWLGSARCKRTCAAYISIATERSTEACKRKTMTPLRSYWAFSPSGSAQRLHSLLDSGLCRGVWTDVLCPTCTLPALQLLCHAASQAWPACRTWHNDTDCMCIRMCVCVCVILNSETEFLVLCCV